MRPPCSTLLSVFMCSPLFLAEASHSIAQLINIHEVFDVVVELLIKASVENTTLDATLLCFYVLALTLPGGPARNGTTTLHTRSLRCPRRAPQKSKC